MEEKKRSRKNGTFRWTEQQTKDLLAVVAENVRANPEQFEKPTAQKFYERITQNAQTLQTIKWDVMRSKMRHLKASLNSALKWKGETGAGLLENGDVKSVEEYIKKICPFYDDLYDIFGRRVNVQPPAIYQSSEPTLSLETIEVDVLLESDAETSSPSLLESPLASPSFVFSSNSEHVANPSVASGVCTQNITSTPHAANPSVASGVCPQNITSTPHAANPSVASGVCPQNITSTPHAANPSVASGVCTPKRNLKRPHNSNPFALLFEIQTKKVDLESKKLEFEKEKEENKFMLQKLQLEKEERIEMERLRLEHERLKSLDKP